MTQSADSALQQLDLTEYPPDDTYLDDYRKVWIGSKWDIAQDSTGRFAIYRKGNYAITVNSFHLACCIVADALGLTYTAQIDISGVES